ncbi:MAG: ABC transporter permease [Ignavibacteria bacterium]|nr:ABC transporter permease [Ignavibacteria bacterium]
MYFEKFIARRYLLSKKKIQFITIITVISITGVAVGVGALITVLSVFNGFSKYQLDILTGFDPHIRIEPDSGKILRDYQSVLKKSESLKNILAASPYTLNKAVISSRKNNVVAFLKGVEEKKIALVSDVAEKTTIGSFEFSDSEEYGGIILGGSLAARLDARVLDTLTVMSPAGMETALTQIVVPKTMKLVVRGIFDSNNREYDKMYSFISLPKSQQLFELKNAVNGVDVKLKDIDDSEDARNELINLLGAGYLINTWYNLHEDLYSVMKIERLTAFIILSLIIGVASFSIIGSLTMTVIEKRRDIGILKSMGAGKGSIMKIFMFEGVLIGIYGTVAGIILGTLVCFAQIKLKLFPLDPMVYSIDALPVDIRYFDYLYVSIASMTLSFLASLYPASRAASQEPIKAIRWE